MFYAFGGVNATNYYGQVPSCISNFKYTDYDIFVGSKELKFTWTVTDAEKAENSYLYYYVTNEETRGWFTHAMTQENMQIFYDAAYDALEGVDGYSYSYSPGEAPDKDETHPHGYWYNNENFKQHEAWYYGEFGDLVNDYSISVSNSIYPLSDGKNFPLEVGRRIDWDASYAWYGHGLENRLQKVALSAGELDLGTITKGCCVFFMMKDESRNNYFGPDETTGRDDDDAKDPYDDYPMNGCWTSANFCLPGIVKVSVKSEGDADYHEVVAGGDTRFSGTALVKLELNTDFLDALGVYYDSDYEVVYEIDGTSPTSDSPVFSDPIAISENTIIHYALKDNYGSIYGANSELNQRYYLPSSIANAVNYYYCNAYGYQQFWDLANVDYYMSRKDYQLDIRDKYQWSNTFVKNDVEEVTITLQNPLPAINWYNYYAESWNSTKYGKYSPNCAWQTWVSDDDYLIPSSLAGYLDFYIYSDGDMTMYRVNWLPKNMPVVVRYANMSATHQNELGSTCYYSPCSPQSFTVYKGNSSHASASDGRYRLGGYTFYNYLHYYEDGTHAVPSAEEQSEANKYYYGLAVSANEGDLCGKWKNIVTGNFKARKAFMILQKSEWDSEKWENYEEGGAESKPLTNADGDGVLSHGMAEETSVILEVTAAGAADAQLFNLAGQRVGKDYHGIVVKKGKKMIVK